MDTKAIAESLRQLAAGHENRSKAARLNDVHTDVEAAAAAGVRRTEIVKVLAANGLEISEKSLGVMLSRIRKKKNKQSIGASHVSSLPASLAGPPSLSGSPDEASNTLPTAPSADTASYDPAGLKAVMRSKPSLDHYARIHRKSNGKE